jgi:hypothetical protein
MVARVVAMTVSSSTTKMRIRFSGCAVAASLIFSDVDLLSPAAAEAL